MKYSPSLSALVNMHDDATLDEILSISLVASDNTGAEMPHRGIGEWEIVGFAAKRATTSYNLRIPVSMLRLGFCTLKSKQSFRNPMLICPCQRSGAFICGAGGLYHCYME
jgi:hypothetical protein